MSNKPAKIGEDIKIGIKAYGKGNDLANGIFDEFIIYDRPLTPSQVKANYRGAFKAENAPRVRTSKERVNRSRTFRLSFDEGFSADQSVG